MQRLKKLKWSLLKPGVAKIHGVALEISAPQISAEMRRKIYLGDYEKEERDIMERTLTAGDRILEFGSGMGYLAIFCSMRVGSENVMTVEANPEMESIIRRNFALNEVNPTLKMGLVGAQTGEAMLHFEEHFWSNSTLPTARSVRSRTVPMIAADELIREHRPNVLICDVEGGEQSILSQLSLEHLGLRDIVVELHPRRLGDTACSDLVARIMQQGYIVKVDQCRFGTMAFRRRDAA